MGIKEDIETILQEVPKGYQTLLFSATMPKPIKDLAQRFMNEPEFISIKAKEVTVPNTHGDLNQAKREAVLCHFKEGITEILVATGSGGLCPQDWPDGAGRENRFGHNLCDSEGIEPIAFN